MTKTVLDANIIISGLFWRGTPYRYLLAALAGVFEFIITEDILDELNSVLEIKFHLSRDERKRSTRYIRQSIF